MQIPDTFSDRLERDFGGRLRLRWSAARGEFHVEQKVGRASLPPLPPRFKSFAEYRRRADSVMRARDGYAFVLAVGPGDRTGCDTKGCTGVLQVPYRESREVKCPRCGASQVLAFFPLGDALIEHLQSIDPERRGARQLLEGLRSHDNRRDLATEALAREAAEEVRDQLISQLPS